MSLSKYAATTIRRNEGQQEAFITSIRHLHANNAIQLCELEDKWKKGTTVEFEPATSKASKDLSDSFDQLFKILHLQNIGQEKSYKWLNTRLSQWKRDHHNVDVVNSKATFSKRTVKCLLKQYELPKMGEFRLRILSFFSLIN